jgi:hypothetical protein
LNKSKTEEPASQQASKQTKKMILKKKENGREFMCKQEQ